MKLNFHGNTKSKLSHSVIGCTCKAFCMIFCIFLHLYKFEYNLLVVVQSLNENQNDVIIPNVLID
jgi:hypothetical protein